MTKCNEEVRILRQE